MTIFKDKTKLSPHYIPKILPHREKQLKMFLGLYSDVIERPAYPIITQAIGGVGTGKTCTTIRFGETLEEEAKRKGVDLKHVYVNLKMLGGSRVVLYRSIVEQASPEIYSASLSAEELLRQLVRYLQDKGRKLIISLDEIDYFIKHTKERVIYDLTRLSEITPGKPSGVVGVIFIARDKSYHELLDRSELSTLGRNYVEFPRYSSKQIVDILEARVQEAFKPNTVPEEVLEYIADVTVAPPVFGDIRYALDLLLYTGNLADNEGSSRITPEHVRKVHSVMFHGLTEEDILGLPNKEKIVLLGIVRALKAYNEPYVSLKDIREYCELVCEELGVKKIGDIEEYVQDLCDRGIIDIKSLTKIGISGVPTEKLGQFLDNILQRVKVERTRPKKRD